MGGPTPVGLTQTLQDQGGPCLMDGEKIVLSDRNSPMCRGARRGTARVEKRPTRDAGLCVSVQSAVCLQPPVAC